VEVFKQWPKTEHVTRWLDTVIQSIGAAPEHLISDKGSQFGEEYRDWCTARGIAPRFGAVGQHGAIAVVERFILSLKDECTRRILVPLRVDRFRDELYRYVRWYNEFRPHQSRGGRTPLEVEHGLTTALPVQLETRPRIYELKQRRRKPGADTVLVDDLRLRVERLDGRAHLPIVRLDRAA
jgi:transposase InsO family protein